MSLYQDLAKPFFVLAPMDDVTDSVFRQVVGQCAAPDVFVTEFVNVDGLQSPGRQQVAKRLRTSGNATEKPLVAQLWGLNPENFRKTAREIVDGVYGGFAGIDLNMGCPIKTIISNGACSALINNRELAVEIIKATQEGAAGKLPVSVKTRLGFNEIDLSWHELLLQQNLAALVVHGRTRKDMSKVPAQWDQIGKVRELRDKIAPGTAIIGNGDVLSREQGEALAKQYMLDGIMVGRGIFHDPFLFGKPSVWPKYSRQQKLELYTKHVKLFTETWEPGERPIHTLNKFCKIYINGFEGAKELRERLMKANSAEDLQSLLAEAQLETAV